MVLVLVGAGAIGLWTSHTEKREVNAGQPAVAVAATNPTPTASSPEVPAPEPDVDPNSIVIVGPPLPESTPGTPTVAASGESTASPWGVATPNKPSSVATVSTGGETEGTITTVTGSPAQRLAALERLAADPNTTTAIGDVMRRDSDAGVVKRAYKLIEDRWDGGVGNKSEAAAQVKVRLASRAPD